MKKKSAKIALLSFIASSSILAMTFSSVTLAKYIEGKTINQSAYGLGGERKVSIYFNPNVWTQGKDSSGNIVDAAFYLYVWYNNGVSDSNQAILSPSSHISPIVSSTLMDLYVFEYDATTLNRMIFLRWNPECAPSTTLTAENGKWNQTVDITYSPSVNYYCIDSWDTAGSVGVATPNTNKIVKANDGTLSWNN